MDKIAMVKKEIQLQNWSDKELARQESGLTVTEWCRQEKISTSAYYYRLRKIREILCKQIPVPVYMPPQKPHVHGLLTAPCRKNNRTLPHL